MSSPVSPTCPTRGEDRHRRVSADRPAGESPRPADRLGPRTTRSGDPHPRSRRRPGGRGGRQARRAAIDGPISSEPPAFNAPSEPLTPGGPGMQRRTPLTAIAMPQGLDVLPSATPSSTCSPRCDDAFLLIQNVHKGAMQLIDEARAEGLYGAWGRRRSCRAARANTAAGVAVLRRPRGFIGKVRDDETGRHLRPRSPGRRRPLRRSPRAGRARHRAQLHPGDAGRRAHDEHLSRRLPGPHARGCRPGHRAAPRIVYLEGYLWDPPAAKEAFRKAVRIAHEAGNKVALTLSDAFCVDRYRDEFLGLMRDGSLDILFANIHELQSLYGTRTPARPSRPCARRTCSASSPARPKAPSWSPAARPGRCRPFPVDRVVDTTDAGDLFASGFMAGLTLRTSTSSIARAWAPRGGRDHQPSRRPSAGGPARSGAPARAAGLTPSGARGGMETPSCFEGRCFAAPQHEGYGGAPTGGFAAPLTLLHPEAGSSFPLTLRRLAHPSPSP